MKTRKSFIQVAFVVSVFFGLSGLVHLPMMGQADAGKGRWLLPNFAQRLELEVSNPSDSEAYGIAVIPVSEASQVALYFPGSLAIAVMPNESGEPYPFSILPSQADDLDGDGGADEFVFPVTLKAREIRKVHIYYSTTLQDRITYPKKVNAHHNFGYNHQVIALESEIIGYRFYGFFADVQGRVPGSPGLNNNLVGYFGSGNPSIAGRDIVHIGDTLGLGGLFIRRDKQVFKPPMNVADYAHKPSPSDVPRYRVIADGPVRAVVEAWIDCWKVDNDEIRLQAIYSIGADMAHLDCRVNLFPLHISGNRLYEVGVGIRHLPEGQLIDHAPGRLLISGTEDPKVGPLALALFCSADDVLRTETVASREAGNEAVILKQKLKNGETVSFRYSLSASWAGGGVQDMIGYLKKVEVNSRVRIRTGNFRVTRTPTPERIDGES